MPIQENGKLQPRLGVVVTTWSHEDGATYAAQLPAEFPRYVPAGQLELVVYPTCLETESDIPNIVQFFSDKTIDALCLIPGNFTLDHVMPLMAQALGLPTLLWGLPTREAWGALVCMHQTTFAFKELGLPFRLVVGELGDNRVWERALPFLRGAALLRRMKGMRIGLMGWRAQGMSDMVFDELALRETFGAQVVNLELTRYVRMSRGLAEEQVGTVWNELRPGFDTTDLPDEVGRFGVRSLLAMKQLAAEENLRAITLECFPEHLGEPCLGCSLLNDDGIAAPCEADVTASIPMTAGWLLTGEATFHADLIVADMDKNSAVMGHCGNLPYKLAADSKRVKLFPMPGHYGPSTFGPNISATMKSGPVTAVNLVGRRGNMRMAFLEGEAVPYELEFPGSWTKVKFGFDLADALEGLGNAGYGHHWSIVQGHVGRELDEWCNLLKIEHSGRPAPNGSQN